MSTVPSADSAPASEDELLNQTTSSDRFVQRDSKRTRDRLMESVTIPQTPVVASQPSALPHKRVSPPSFCLCLSHLALRLTAWQQGCGSCSSHRACSNTAITAITTMNDLLRLTPLNLLNPLPREQHNHSTRTDLLDIRIHRHCTRHRHIRPSSTAHCVRMACTHRPHTAA